MTTTDFEAFFRGSYRDLIRYVTMLGASVSDADEVAQEAMTAAYRRWPRIDNPKAWTWRVACRTYLRADRRRRLREVLAPAEHLPDRAGVDPADALLGTYRVRTLLRGLATRQRRVVAWWLDGYQFDEIAQKLDVKTATVRSLFRHARKRLQERFRNESSGSGASKIKGSRWLSQQPSASPDHGRSTRTRRRVPDSRRWR